MFFLIVNLTGFSPAFGSVYTGVASVAVCVSSGVASVIVCVSTCDASVAVCRSSVTISPGSSDHPENWYPSLVGFGSNLTVTSFLLYDIPSSQYTLSSTGTLPLPVLSAYVTLYVAHACHTA